MKFKVEIQLMRYLLMRLFCIACSFLLLYSSSCATEPTLLICTAESGVEFNLEIADTPEKRRIGLMHRESLDLHTGMLFTYSEARKIAIWMKNTHIPLDILFIDQQGIIAKVFHHAEPFSLQTISSEQAVVAVLEINAGLAAQFNIRKGDQVFYSLFANEH